MKKGQSIHVTEEFKSQFASLPKIIQKKALKAEQFFRANPFHPSLRLHKLSGKLKGLWSISVDRKYRIIFTSVEEGVVLFISTGIHSIYEKESR
jgi:addiction module RelE/StbE family toxin